MPTYVTAIREVNNARFVVRWSRNGNQGLFYMPDAASDVDYWNTVNAGMVGQTGVDSTQVRQLLRYVGYIGNPLCAWPNHNAHPTGPRIRFSLVDDR